MKFLPRLACGFILLATATGVFAAATPTPAQPSAPMSVAPSATALPVSSLKFDDYINDLATTLKLSDEEKKDIASFYQADGTQLQTILNSDSISPLDQDRQVSDLRDARNAKIEALLGSSDRTGAFLKVEAKYRVALIELAADGGLVPPSAPAPTPAPAPAPAAAPAAPVSAKTPPPE